MTFITKSERTVGHHVFKILGSFDKTWGIELQTQDCQCLTTNVSFCIIHNWVGLIDVVIRVRINGKDGTLFYGALDA